jgi:hypothetical protein
MADVRPLAIDDTDSIIRTFHLELEPHHKLPAEPENGIAAPGNGIAASEIGIVA